MVDTDASLQRGLGNLYATWLTIGIALMGQALWFSWQYGTLGQRVTDIERRETLIEQGGSPSLVSVKNQVEINTKRLDIIERYVPDKMLALSTADAAMQERTRAIEDRLLVVARQQEARQLEIASLTAELNQLRGARALPRQQNGGP